MYTMHPALRKGPLFTKHPHFPLFKTKNNPISFPAYGPVVLENRPHFRPTIRWLRPLHDISLVLTPVTILTV